MDETKTEPLNQIPPEIVNELVNLLQDRSKRDKRAESQYANNVAYEPSVWDLRLVFGALLQRLGQTDVDWHTAVTIPWAQAKIMDYYLRLNLVIQEKNNGPISVPPAMVPKLTAPTEEQAKTDPSTLDTFEAFERIHDELFGSLRKRS